MRVFAKGDYWDFTARVFYESCAPALRATWPRQRSRSKRLAWVLPRDDIESVPPPWPGKDPQVTGVDMESCSGHVIAVVDANAGAYKAQRISGFDLQQLFLWFVGNIYCNCWNNCCLLVLWRLTKSGIEYVILAGSSLFPLSEADTRF